MKLQMTKTTINVNLRMGREYFSFCYQRDHLQISTLVSLAFKSGNILMTPSTIPMVMHTSDLLYVQ